MNEKITVLGKEPVNPIGTCFDSATTIFIRLSPSEFRDAKLCHGIGISNYPGQPDEPIAHAWIEATDKSYGRVALDPIWMVMQPASVYRKNLQVSLVIEYSYRFFLKKWREKKYPGPYDKRILAMTIEGKKSKENNYGSR